jgi:hypothetical protein
MRSLFLRASPKLANCLVGGVPPRPYFFLLLPILGIFETPIPGVGGIGFLLPFAKVFGWVEYKFFAGSFAMFKIRVGHLRLLVAYGSPLG